MFSALDNSNERYVELTLADGETKIKLPRYAEFAISFEADDIFYATPDNNELTLVLPVTLKKADYRSIMATVTEIKGGTVHVKSGDDWIINISAPVFDGEGVLVEGSAKVSVTGCEDSRLSDTYLLKVALVSADGKEVTASRLIKYFNGVIAESQSDITDNSIQRLAWKGNITEENFAYIRDNMASTLKVLDLSSTELAELPDKALAFYAEQRYEPNKILQTVILPETLRRTGKAAFGNCVNLQYVYLPKSLNELADRTFDNCDKLQNVELPHNLTVIGEGAFNACNSITAITIPSSVTKLPDYAFQKCGNLERISVHDAITYIGKGAFSECKFLKKFTVPAGVAVLNDSTFNECASLKFINWHNNITSIGKRAFYHCVSLSHPLTKDRLALPLNLSSMDMQAFAGCTNLEKIDMRDTPLKVIQSRTFEGCRNLTEVSLPLQLNSIQASAFEQTNIKQIILLPSLKYIGSEAFRSTPLEIVYSHAEVAPSLGIMVFSVYTKGKGVLLIPASSRSSYTEEEWVDYFFDVYTNL